MTVTEQDRERAREVLNVFGPTTDVRASRIELIAAALADERERARAPFLALAEEWSQTSASYARIAKKGDRSSDLIASLSGDAAMRIRRAAEESQ